MSFLRSAVGAIFVFGLACEPGAYAQAVRFASAAPADGYGYGAGSLAPAAQVIDLRRRARAAETEALLAERPAEAEEAVEQGPDDPAPELEVADLPPAPPAPTADAGFVVQIGAFSDPANAARVRAAVAAAGPAYVEEGANAAGRTLFRVRLGPWPSERDAAQARAEAARLGFPDAILTTR
ncbi:MAG: hypothetical protein GC189_01310 [Alphaproteobacteria bacterium]|nr:hypothetical protein [Alphaproteobacteria bacterium]